MHHVASSVQVIDEVVKALMGRYPQAVLQFEDFNMEHAAPLLERYRDHHLCFNDDIQVLTALLRKRSLAYSVQLLIHDYSLRISLQLRNEHLMDAKRSQPPLA